MMMLKKGRSLNIEINLSIKKEYRNKEITRGAMLQARRARFFF
jgi:hypothetical protein